MGKFKLSCTAPCGAGAIVTLVCAACSVQAQTPEAGTQPTNIFALDLNVGATYSDNVTRLLESGDKIEDTVGSAGFALTVDHTSRRLRANVASNLSWLHYFDDTYDSEVVGFFNGDAVLDIVPERFEWFVQETFGQARADIFLADTADNREDISYFTTGPDVTLRLGGASFLTFSGRYSDNSYSNLNFDNQRYGGTLTLGRELSARNVLSLVATSERIDFDDESRNADFDRQAVYLRYAGATARTSLDVSLGYTRLEEFDDTAAGVLAQLQIRRLVSAASSVYLGAESRFSDAGEIFRDALDRQSRLGVATDGSQTIVATDNAFEYRSVFTGYDFARNRTALRVGAIWGRERYERDPAFDRDQLIGTIEFTRELTRELTLLLDTRLDRSSYELADVDVNEQESRVTLAWRPGRRIGMQFGYGYYRRNSTSITSGYRENRLRLGFSYYMGAD